MSVGTGGVQANGDSGIPSISANGRYVAFGSEATNLVSGDTNGSHDIFVRDRFDATERVSVDSLGVEANGHSYLPSISADGRHVAFVSSASNLVGGDTNGEDDVFVRDRWSGTTERASVASSGVEGNNWVWWSSISADGRYVAFTSAASNLVAVDTNGAPDVFVRDRWNGTTERVSVDSSGAQADGDSDVAPPSISADGRYVVFVSSATNLVSGDTNGTEDVFVRDRWSGTTERASVDSLGAEADGPSHLCTASTDGRYVVFVSSATNMVSGDTNAADDVFVHDRWSGSTERVSVDSLEVEANDRSFWSAISADGRHVAFMSSATNLVSGDTNGWDDIFVRDRWSGTTERMSVNSLGAEANFNAVFPSISADGRHVAFISHATNLVSGDTNGVSDIFVRDHERLDVRRPR